MGVIMPAGYPPSRAPPWAVDHAFTANPLGPLAGAPALYSAAEAYAEEDDILELDCEGEAYGMPAAYCVSARRLEYSRPAGRPPWGPAAQGTQV